MERQKPTRQHLEALYDLINELMADKDVYYTSEELAEITNMEGIGTL